MLSGITPALLYCAVHVTAEHDDGRVRKSGSGTGFFVKNNRGELCLITNRHIVDLGYDSESTCRTSAFELVSVYVRGFVATDGKPHNVPNERFGFVILSPPKFGTVYAEDVAAFIAPRIILAEGSTGEISYFLDHEFLATDEWIAANINPCEFVVFPGYPVGRDLYSDRPIVRVGTVSSDPRTNYSHVKLPLGRRVAYEGLSSEGSSGSPVVAPERAFRGGGGIEISGHRESRLIGINAGHIVAKFGQHSGISYFVRSQALLDLIDSP